MIDVGGIHQSVLSWDVPSIMGLYTAVAKDPWLAQTNKFQVHEKVTTGFPEVRHRLEAGQRCRCAAISACSTSIRSRTPMASPGTMVAGTPAGGAVIPVSGGATYY